MIIRLIMIIITIIILYFIQIRHTDDFPSTGYSSSSNNLLSLKVVTSSDGISDHLTVLIDLWLQIKSSPEKANITFRPINKIDLDSLHIDLSNCDLLMHPKTSLTGTNRSII